MIRTPVQLILSCEHATALIPQAYQAIFQGKSQVLNSHRGFDLGACEVARIWQKSTGVPYFEGEVSRLLIDLNRSATHPNLFSSYSKSLSDEERLRIKAQYHDCYWAKLREVVQDIHKNDTIVFHIAVHSFTPVLNGEKRNAHIGLLYDPSRTQERLLAVHWQKSIQNEFEDVKVRRNYPYRGIADGLPTSFRRVFPQEKYIAIELELRQDFLKKRSKESLVSVLNRTFQEALGIITSNYENPILSSHEIPNK